MRLRRKKIGALTVICAMLCGLIACGSAGSDEEAKRESALRTEAEAVSKTQEESKAEESKAEAESKAEESKAEESKAEESKAEAESKTEESKAEESSEAASEPGKQNADKTGSDRFPRPESEGLEFVQDLKIGWNLGNTFDAIDCTWLNNEMDYESAWNGVKTTKEHIDALKKAGFRAVRIPVSWHDHLSDKGSYVISEQWLERVAEIVDYCVEQDLYVIINIHHDNNDQFLYPNKGHLDQSLDYVTAIWGQLAERFGEYDEHLIFDGMNEPRLVGHKNEWWIDDSADCREAIECINQLNQAFVDTVRATGGNNATRYLMCPGYAASPDGVLNEGYVLPTDPVANDHHIIVSVHAYTPYSFALEYPGTDKWSSKRAVDVTNMVSFMNKLYDKYVSQGVPVVIDEFGARDKNGNLDARVDFAGHFVAYARARGMSCFWWDNNAFEGDGELFGLLDRRKCEWRYPEIVDALMEFAE